MFAIKLSSIMIHVGYYGWLISLISSLKYNNDGNQEISDDWTDDPGESTR